MLVSPVKNRKKRAISKDKSKRSKRNTRPTKSSKTSAQGSTLKDPACRPFWNEYTKEQSLKWWSCTKTDSVVMAMSSWNSSSKRLLSHSWFSTQKKQALMPLPENKSWLKTLSLLPMSLSPATTDSVALKIEKDASENEKQLNREEESKTTTQKQKQNKTPLVRARAHKTRLYPTKEQQETLKQWMGTARWTYNQCVAALKARTVKGQKKALRAWTMNEETLGKDHWALKTPYDIRDEGMNDVLKALKTIKALKHTRFDLKFRSKKDEQESLVIHKKHWAHKKGVYAFLHEIPSHEPLPDYKALPADARLLRTRLNHWYLCVPHTKDLVFVAPRENQAGSNSETIPEGEVLALDPGVRTFLTGYDPGGVTWEVGAKDMTRLYRLCYTLDQLQSRWSKPTCRHRKRYRLRRAARRIRLRIRRLIDECHKRTSKWLCENYKVVLLPAFQVSQMVTRGQRRINSKTARAMLTWSHYRFRQRLLQKAELYPTCQVIVCDEAYTSKTCGSCGFLHNKLGGNKTFKCPSCQVVRDRDDNGARNIWLRYLTLQKERLDQQEALETFLQSPS